MSKKNEKKSRSCRPLSHKLAVEIESFADENNIHSQENFEILLSLLGVKRADYLRALN